MLAKHNSLVSVWNYIAAVLQHIAHHSTLRITRTLHFPLDGKQHALTVPNHIYTHFYIICMQPGQIVYTCYAFVSEAQSVNNVVPVMNLSQREHPNLPFYVEGRK